MLDLFTETDTQRLIDYILANHNPHKPLMFYVDLFCGCGGTTNGFKKNENSFVICCVNHDPYAIKSHHANNPHCIHYTEDIRDWTVIWKIESLIKELRIVFKDSVVVLHASLECTHISNAAGGIPRDGDSRTLQFHLEKYLGINPDYITIENVKEILTNGPLDENNRPIKELAGLDYLLWKEMIQDYGYDYEYQFLNTADFGEYTSRNRYYGIFAKHGLPIDFPERTHVSKKDSHLFPDLAIHKPVKDVLNLDNYGVSIFSLNKNGKPYKDKTISRVAGGVKKTLQSKGIIDKEGNPTEYFLSAYYGASQNGQGITSIEEPCNTLTTKDRFSLHHIQYAYGKSCYTSLDEPAGSIVTNPKHELVTTEFIWDTQYNRVSCSIDKPSPVIIARQDKDPLRIAFSKGFSMVDHSVELSGDSEARKELKRFMRKYGIMDISIRMLEIVELLRIQGFPEDYILLGGVTRAKKYIGNSVVPGIAEAIGYTIYNSYLKYLKKVK